MLCYKDKTFCPSGDKNSKKCKECDRYFDVDKYRAFCKGCGCELLVSFFAEKPCEKRNEKGKDNE